MHANHAKTPLMLPLIVAVVTVLALVGASTSNATSGEGLYYGNGTVHEWPAVLTPSGESASSMSTFILTEELSRYALRYSKLPPAEAAAPTYSPNVIRTVQQVYGVIEGWAYEAYDITGTIAVCVNLEYVPRNVTFTIALYDEDTRRAIFFYWNGTGEVSGFCPATDDGNDGFEQIRFANIYPPYYKIYIAYSGTLSRYYW